MFDSRSSNAAADETGQIRGDLAFKVAAQFPSKEVHDLPGGKALHAVAEELGIEFAKSLAILE